MSWSKYAEFLAFAVVLVLIPGPDFAVVTKNTLAGGRRRGRWTALGVSSSNLVQGAAAAAGLGALIVRVEPLFEAIKWAGVAYLAYMGAQAVRSAVRGQDPPGLDGAPASRDGLTGWRQGFVWSPACTASGTCWPAAGCAVAWTPPPARCCSASAPGWPSSTSERPRPAPWLWHAPTPFVTNDFDLAGRGRPQ